MRGLAWTIICSKCGQPYARTNFMSRTVLLPDGRIRGSDTHQARCNGWETFKTPEEARAAHRKRVLAEGEEGSRSLIAKNKNLVRGVFLNMRDIVSCVPSGDAVPETGHRMSSCGPIVAPREQVLTETEEG